jgi:endoglucanase
VRDLNGDGRPDIAATSAVNQGTITAHVTVLINDGAQGFNPGTNYPTDGGGMLAVGDFNSDNQPDLAMTSGSTFIGGNVDGIAVLTNKGNGQFNAAVSVFAGSSVYLAVGDFNNDSKTDAVFTQAANQSVVVLMNNFTASLPCLSLNDVTVTENDTGTTDATFTVTLSASTTSCYLFFCRQLQLQKAWTLRTSPVR